MPHSYVPKFEFLKSDFDYVFKGFGRFAYFQKRREMNGRIELSFPSVSVKEREEL